MIKYQKFGKKCRRIWWMEAKKRDGITNKQTKCIFGLFGMIKDWYDTWLFFQRRRKYDASVCCIWRYFCIFWILLIIWTISFDDCFQDVLLFWLLFWKKSMECFVLFICISYNIQSTNHKSWNQFLVNKDLISWNISLGSHASSVCWVRLHTIKAGYKCWLSR